MEKVKLVPPQRKGSGTGAQRNIHANTRHDAILLFSAAKKRLLGINSWEQLCGEGSASFHLTDEQGNEIQSVPQVGNLIRIGLRGSENESGNSSEWVRIEAFEDEKDLLKDLEIFGFRVRPVPSPTGNNTEEAHHYTDQATNTFLVVRSANIVTAAEKGRNEKINLKPSSFWNKVRNILIGTASKIGLANPQWDRLVKGLLHGPPKKD
jgi:hypothetical protein